MVKKNTSLALLGAAGAGLAAVLGARAIRRQRVRMDFTGKTVVISGGSRGLGLVLARLLAEEGANLALLARGREELDQAEQELRTYGVEVSTFTCDVGSEAEVDRVLGTVVEQYGSLDVLFNVAGVIQVGPIDHMQLEDFQEAMDVHFWGPFYMAMTAVPYMRRQGGGRIVNISSIGGVVGVPHLAPYVASKFALTGFSDVLRAELATDGIAVTTVTPGLMRTGSHVNAYFKGRNDKEYAWFSMMASLPITTTSAENAARQIIEACRYKTPSLVITPQARLMVAANALMPNLTAWGMQLFDRLLPRAQPGGGGRRRTGWESQSEWSPSLLTWWGDRTLAEHNQLRGHEPIARKELPG